MHGGSAGTADHVDLAAILFSEVAPFRDKLSHGIRQ
jgi:hypothetical protein